MLARINPIRSDGNAITRREDTVEPGADGKEDGRQHVPNDAQRVTFHTAVHGAEEDALAKVLRSEDLVALPREVIELVHGHRRERMLRGKIAVQVIDAEDWQIQVPEEFTNIRIDLRRPIEVSQAAQRRHILDSSNLRETIHGRNMKSVLLELQSRIRSRRVVG